jgi:hypothetical protein
MYISGAPDSRWNNNDLSQLKTLTAADFEAVQVRALYTPSNVPKGPSPTIVSFTANPMTVSAGQPVTMSWSVTGSLYNILSPQAGPVRGNSITLTPSATTTYQLYTTNQYGRTAASVTVTVH